MFIADAYLSLKGEPHSTGMRMMEGYSDNTLYYSEENDSYWLRRDSKDIKGEDGSVIGTSYTIDVYSDYKYDSESGKYVGSGTKHTLQGTQYKGRAAYEVLQSLVRG